jgi:hypothetical protein
VDDDGGDQQGGDLVEELGRQAALHDVGGS